MPRTHGYAPVGERCVGKHDGHRQRAYQCHRCVVSFLLTHSDVIYANGQRRCIFCLAFARFTAQTTSKLGYRHGQCPLSQTCRLPASHRTTGASAGVSTPLLADLNPIEHKWVQANALRRQKMFY